MKKEIVIGEKVVSDSSDVFVIAEIGVNHNGDPDLAKKMIKQAVQCGVDCVKFQTFKAESVVTPKAPKAAYQLDLTDKSESQLEMLKKLELSVEAHADLKKYAESLGVVFMSTPYNFHDIDLLDKIDVAAYKVASGQIVEPEFLRRLARKGKPIILSTGMATFSEVDEALRIIKNEGNESVVILQCTTNYPSKIEDTHLRAMQAMSGAFDCLVGYSDHTVGDEAVMAAVSLGACIIEKHFTLDRYMEGPDHFASITPDELKSLVEKIRRIESCLGSALKNPSASEAINSKNMRRSIVALNDINMGEIIKEEDISFKRPATGLHPKFYNQIIGKNAKKDIKKDELLSMEVIEW